MQNQICSGKICSKKKSHPIEDFKGIQYGKEVIFKTCIRCRNRDAELNRIRKQKVLGELNEIKENENKKICTGKKCKGTVIKNKEDFTLEGNEYNHCNECREYSQKYENKNKPKANLDEKIFYVCKSCKQQEIEKDEILCTACIRKFLIGKKYTKYSDIYDPEVDIKDEENIKKCTGRDCVRKNRYYHKKYFKFIDINDKEQISSTCLGCRDKDKRNRHIRDYKETFVNPNKIINVEKFKQYKSEENKLEIEKFKEKYNYLKEEDFSDIGENNSDSEIELCNICHKLRKSKYFIVNNGKGTSPNCIMCRNIRNVYSTKTKIKQSEIRNNNPELKEKFNENKRNYRKNNPEQFAGYNEKRRLDPLEHIKNIKHHIKNYNYNAKRKNINGYNERQWKLSDEEAIFLLKDDCFYCGEVCNPNIKLHCIDRIYHNKNYTIDNVCSSCYICSMMKKDLDWNIFIMYCRNITKFNFKQYEIKNWNYGNIFKNFKTDNYSKFINDAEKRNIVVNLTEEEFNNIKKLPCKYCNKKTEINHSNGIDRINSSENYNIKNCVPCCANCNYLKRSYSVDEFLNKCKEISKYTKYIKLSSENMKVCNGKNCNGKQIHNIKDFIENEINFETCNNCRKINKEYKAEKREIVKKEKQKIKEDQKIKEEQNKNQPIKKSNKICNGMLCKGKVEHLIDEFIVGLREMKTCHDCREKNKKNRNLNK